MKLLYITNGINGSGGLERVLSIKASYLAEEYGYDITILSLNNTHLNPFFKFSPKLNLSSISVGGNPVKYIIEYKNGLQKLVDEIEPDVISVCDDGLKGFFIPQILKTEAKIIYERHVSKLIEARGSHGFLKKRLIAAKWKLMDRLAGGFSKFIVLTEGNKREWQNLRNLTVIPNPLSFYPQESSELKNKIVICVGKISYQKGQDLLVKAWEKVHEKHPQWELHLYGKKYLDFLDTHNLKNNIHFFPPTTQIEKKYLESSVYVMSSRFEGFGMVLIEAMACGVPCVSFDCEYGPADIISNNRDGILVPKENVTELASKLMMLIENNELRLKFGKQAKRSVQRFEVQAIAQRWDQLFKELVQ